MRRGWNEYDAFLSFDPGAEPPDRILEQFTTWLREKGIETDLRESLVEVHGDRELVVVHHQVNHGHDVSARLVEPTPLGNWRTQITMHTGTLDPGWLRIRVTNDEGRFVDVPRLATYAMDAVDTSDGPAMFTSEPRTFRGDQAEELLDLICDPDRAALAFVAGSDDSLPFEPLVAAVTSWTKQVRGLGHVIVLDPLATAAFEALVGESHRVPAGTIRTFLPVVDPATWADGRRHRILGSKRLADQHDRDIRQMLGRIARDHASARVLPAAVSKAERSLRRVEDSVLVDQIQPTAIGRDPMSAHKAEIERAVDAQAAVGDATAAALPEQVELYLAQVELVKATLGIDSLDEAQLRKVAGLIEQARMKAAAVDRVTRQLQEREERINELEEEVEFYKELNLETDFDVAVAEDVQVKLEDENLWLRRRLRDLKDYEASSGSVPLEAQTVFPRSFEELLERVDGFGAHGVVFCGDHRVTRDLDDVDSNERFVRAAWTGFLVLADYVRAREAGDFSGGLDTYVPQTPAGYRTVPPKKFASTETGVTMRNHGDERVLPVPTEVDPSGCAEMKTHFKLGKLGMVSPRMYVLDRYSLDGRMYVGYIGAHMTNTMTN